MKPANVKTLAHNYKERLDAFDRKYKRIDASSDNPVLELVSIIKGWQFGKDSKGLKSWEQSFKDCVFPFKNRSLKDLLNIKQKLNYGPKLLYYPCKPNAEEYQQFKNSYMPVSSSISNYSLIENELNAVVDGGQKYSMDAHRFPLTENLTPTILSHATLLDFIFANADVSSESKYPDSITACFYAFIELYNEEPRFRERLDDGLMSQAMYNASEDVAEYVEHECPALLKFTMVEDELSK